jgi:myo-inositol-hexaphosphate 3-phosphohydrolase
MPLRTVRRAIVLLAVVLGYAPAAVRAQTVVAPRLTLADPAMRDQDDMCFWLHPSDEALSTIITSDKSANRLFVYDLAGATLQTIAVSGEPGNVDTRYNVPLGGALVDLVAINDRVDRRIKVFQVDPSTRQLTRVDDGAIQTGENYGICLYRSPFTGALYAFTTSQSGAIEQYALSEQGGLVTGTLVRSWNLSGRTEGCVCDDETGKAYLGEERVGIWKVDAEPSDPTVGSLIARVGDPSGLTADVEGLAIYYAADGGGYLIASSQGSSDFRVYDRRSPHAHLRTFSVSDVFQTDGVDVTNLDLGPTFPAGMFAAHSHIEGVPKPVRVCGFEDVGLPPDVGYWNPRRAGTFPLITSFAPTVGAIGTEVTIAGVRLNAASEVTFRGVPAVFTVDSDVQIRAVVPPGAATGPIRVLTAAGPGISPSSFGVPRPPSIASFTPLSGPAGTAVTIQGTELYTTTAVTFRDAAAIFSIISDSELRAVVPAGAFSGPIQVINPAASSTSEAAFTVSTSPSRRTFLPIHDARVVSSNPNSSYGAVTPLRVRSATADPAYRTYLKFDVADLNGGTVLGATLRLYCDDESVDGGMVHAVANDYTVTAAPWLESGLTWNNAPPLAGAALDLKGAVPLGTWVEFDVGAAVPGEGVYSFGMASNSANIAGYSSKEGAHPPELVLDLQIAPPPAIESFAPTSGITGTEVTVTGSGFAAVRAVDFNGVPADFMIDSDARLRAIVPAGASTGRIHVTSPDGTGSSGLDFLVIAMPVTESFEPIAGPVGTDVTITGLGLGAATSVMFHDTPASFEIDSDTKLLAVVPVGATTGPIAVTNAAGTAVSSDAFVVNRAPTILDFVPRSGFVGSEVTVAGREFATATAVDFNGTAAEFVIDSDTQLRATVPAGASTGRLHVFNADGIATSASDFRVFREPTLTAFAPARGPVGAEVTVAGDNLGTATAVDFNGAAAAFTVDSDTQLRAFAPPDATTGRIHVTNPVGTGSSAADFVVIQGPTLASFRPTSGPVGIEVVIVGTELGSTSTVGFDAATASFTIVSEIELRATVPPGATTGPIRITNPAGTASSTADFVVTRVPTITTFVPASGPVGTAVTVTGTEFDIATAVDFNGVDASFVVDGPSQLRATVPSGATSGPIRVTNPDGAALSPVDFTVTFPPSRVTFTPIHDSRVVSSSPNGTAGAVTVLRVRSVDPTYRSYLKFSVTGLSGVVRSARLRLHCDDASVDGGTVYAVSNDYQGSTTPWVEGGLTWNNVPAIAGPALDQKQSVVVGRWIEFDVTPAVAGDGVLSFGLTSGSTNIAGYSSKEGGYPPELVVDLDSGSDPKPPSISAIAPMSGPVGTAVTVTGTGFATATAVDFAGTPATFVIDSDVQLRTAASPGSTSGPIRVSNPYGSAVSPFEFTLTEPPLQVTFTPAHDTRVVSSTPDGSAGSVTVLRVRSPTADPAYRTYLKFEVSGLAGPPANATLRLYCDDPSVDGGAIYAVANVYAGTATPWVEGGLTWNNAPALQGTALDRRQSVIAGAWVEFDVTPAVTGSGTFSFGMNSGSTNIAGYNSKEGAHPPELVVRATSASSAPAVPSRHQDPPLLRVARAFPNPFSGQTGLHFELSRAARVRATIYDVHGRVVDKPASRSYATGAHTYRWEGRDAGGRLLPSGIYFIRLEAAAVAVTQKLVLAR